MDGQPPSLGWSPIIQNPPEGSVQQTYDLALGLNSQSQNQVKCRKVSPHLQDGHQPSKGWSPTIPNTPEGSVLQAWNLAHKHNS